MNDTEQRLPVILARHPRLAVAPVSEPPSDKEELTQALARARAKKVTVPEAMAADVLEAIDRADWAATVDALRDLNTAALGEPSDTRLIEKMLLTQSVVLQILFTHYILRSSQADMVLVEQTFTDLALKAQNQCRRTLATLAEIRNPRRTQFIRQTNVAHGHQQVNNATVETREISEAQTNKLLEVNHAEGRRLDVGAAALAVGSGSSLEAVGALHRPENTRREGSE